MQESDIISKDHESPSTHPKFEPTGIRTHDLQIMDNTFHVPETFTLTSKPSGVKWMKSRSLHSFDTKFCFCCQISCLCDLGI